MQKEIKAGTIPEMLWVKFKPVIEKYSIKINHNRPLNGGSISPLEWQVQRLVENINKKKDNLK
jgi:hypothetical protein